MFRKRGLRHASEKATMPMPGSTVDQTDRPALMNKKSLVYDSWWIWGIRIMVAIEPL
jgi:hypothetical protein